MHWMKEVEAKQKWCPMTRFRIGAVVDVGDNQSAVLDDNNCIGEGCACWQPQYADKRELGRCGMTHAL